MSKAKKIIQAVLLTILLWGVGYFLFVGSILLAKPDQADQKTEAIVVLTGGKDRIETGLKLFADGLSPELFISGVFPSIKKRDIVKKWDGNTPLPVCCITLGRKATTTVQNAKETEEWLEEKNYKSIRLVTSDYHINRAFMEFKDRLHDTKIYAHPIQQKNATPAQPWFWIISFVEYNKTLIQWGRIILSPPETLGHGHH